MSILDTPIERRKVLKGFLIAGPTLAIAVRVGMDGPVGAFPVTTEEQADQQDFVDHMVLFGAATPANYDLLIEIKPDGRVYAEIPKMDIGQGVLGISAQMIADHLDATYESMDVILAPADQKWQTMQFTGASENARTLWDPIRFAGAKMRGQLMAAASERMGIPVSQLRTEDGYVLARDGQKLSYGELSARASQLNAPAAMPKTSKDFKIIGQPKVKYQMDKIAQGTFPYAMDRFSSKEYLPTVVALGKTHGASVVSIDDSAAKAIKGVIAITHVPGMADYLIPEAVAVTAETFGIAKKAKDALKIQWSAGPMDNLSDTQIDDLLNGIIDKVSAPGEGIEGTFRWPYVPHAPMEANSAVANVTAGKAELWGGNQIPGPLQRHLAETLGLQVEQVLYHVIPAGGAFGRHLFHDQEIHAAQVSQRIGKPVKVQWMREEDIKWGRTRPVSIHKVKAVVSNGDVTSFEHVMACPELDLRHGLGDIVSGYITEYNNEGACQYFWDFTQKLQYKTGPTSYKLKQKLLAKPTAAWRVVYSGQVHPVDEIIIDELARMAGKDEVEWRMANLDTDRARAVLEKCANEAQWGRSLPKGVAQGVAMHDEYKSIAAYIMEIDTRGNEPRMTRCTIAADVGYCINPTGTTASLLGQAHDGFALVYRAGLHVDNGATRESNFHDYKWTRMFDSAPEMSVHILPNSNVVPGGVGELGVPAAAGAAANAWARATGKQARNFPLNEYGA